MIGESCELGLMCHCKDWGAWYVYRMGGVMLSRMAATQPTRNCTGETGVFCGPIQIVHLAEVYMFTFMELGGVHDS